MLNRAYRGLKRFGAIGIVTRISSLAGRSLSRMVHVRERHLWYVLDLAAPLSRTACPPGFELSKASDGDVALLEQLPTIGTYEARTRRSAGAELWLMREGSQAAFACWIFRDRTPVFAVRRGWLSLPPDTVCLEDSVTSPAYRGRGLAGAAWSGIAHVLQGQQVLAIITKVAEDNTASRRAVEKAGFLPVAMMTLTRWGLRSRVELQPLRIDALTTFLEAALSR